MKVISVYNKKVIYNPEKDLEYNNLYYLEIS